MGEKQKKVLVYEKDQQTASCIEFGVRQFDLTPLKASSREAAQRLLQEEPFGIAFVNAALPALSLQEGTVIVPILDRGASRDDLLSGCSYVRVLYKPAGIFEVMAIIKNILEPAVAHSRDYFYHMLRSKMMLRYLQFLLAGIRNDTSAQFTMKEGIYEFCVGTCPHAVAGDLPDRQDQKKYHLLTVSAQHGKRQCLQFDECKLHKFSAWMQQEHKELLGKRPADVFPQHADNGHVEKMRETIDRLLEQQDAAIQRFYELKKDFCTHCCDTARSGTDFREGYVLISEWADIFRNQCVFCPEPECPLNQFFDLLVYQLKTV